MHGNNYSSSKGVAGMISYQYLHAGLPQCPLAALQGIALARLALRHHLPRKDFCLSAWPTA